MQEGAIGFHSPEDSKGLRTSPLPGTAPYPVRKAPNPVVDPTP